MCSLRMNSNVNDNEYSSILLLKVFVEFHREMTAKGNLPCEEDCAARSELV